MSRQPTFRTWFTHEESSWDRRTQSLARLRERDRIADDRPGKEPTVWDWRLLKRDGSVVRGTAQNQKAARAAVRKIARTLPDGYS